MIGTTSSIIPVLASATSFVLYAAMGNKLDASVIFPALAYYTSMRQQMNNWPQTFSVLTDARVSAKRIEEFLAAEEIQQLPKPDRTCPWAIEIEDGCFYWDRVLGAKKYNNGRDRRHKTLGNGKPRDEPADGHHGQISGNGSPPSRSHAVDAPTTDSEPIQLNESSTRNIFLRDIQLRIPRGALVAVIGAVGHGKSSLLQAMVGSMPMQSGRLVRGAATSFAAQQPWIQNATVRDNILFGLPYDAVRYNRVIRACQLERDLANLPRGDLTELGERGINLSGGQKARVSLARAVYFQSEDVDGELIHGGDSSSASDDPEKAAENRITPSTIVIMDDPLAAVDAHVGKRLWRDCILTELQGRTRIVATHQLHVLPDVDLIVCMRDGRIDQIGSYQELMEDPSHDGFRTLVAEYGGVSIAAAAKFNLDDSRRRDNRAGVDEAALSTDKEVVEEDRTRPCRNNGDFLSTTTPTTATASATSLVTSNDTKPDSEAVGKQIVKEERKYGAIALQSYRKFFRAIGLAVWAAVFSTYLLQQAAGVM
ncbi:hypothetical protein DFQ26_009409 [Actinomortierella ambigua]|nr:hypothetical protein DFQ26_009409 [Actinomortierella ambigua]